MNTVGIGATRNSAAWVRALSSQGEAQSVAIGELTAHLLRAALYALSRAAMPRPGLARAQVERIAEACTREAVRVILDRLPDFRPESQFTTWAYKFVVREALAAARAHAGEAMVVEKLTTALPAGSRQPIRPSECHVEIRRASE